MQNSIVTQDEIERSTAFQVNVGSSGGQLIPTRLGRKRRTQFIITNLSPVAVTIAKSDEVPTLNSGVILQQFQTLIETNSNGFSCWQGAVTGVASSTATLSVTEVFNV